jgi:hypothetical protein
VPLKDKLTFVYALSGPLTISSAMCLLYGGRGLYEPYPASLAGLVGQDLLALAAFVPLLLASMWLTVHGSTRGLLLLGGLAALGGLYL